MHNNGIRRLRKALYGIAMAIGRGTLFLSSRANASNSPACDISPPSMPETKLALDMALRDIEQA